jgi:hypothetical protein
MLKSPTQTDPIQLADWMEIFSLMSGDRNSSGGDLASVLTVTSLMDPERSDAIDAKVADVFTELEARALAAGSGYPFLVEHGYLEAREDWPEFSAYVFCLLLSHLRWTRPKGSAFFPQRMFESLCVEVARQWINGQGIRFGAPRRKEEMPPSFAKAIDVLCLDHLREGKGFKHEETPEWRGDYGVDIVAWRDWPDQLPGKLVLFGNCASGDDWDSKRTELLPELLQKRWMNGPDSPVIRAFFVPHRIAAKEWRATVQEAGILFDRCRIASVVRSLPKENHHGDGLIWIKDRITSKVEAA